MRDIDELLREDAQRWQTRLPEPPEFAATLAGVVAQDLIDVAHQYSSPNSSCSRVRASDSVDLTVPTEHDMASATPATGRSR